MDLATRLTLRDDFTRPDDAPHRQVGARARDAVAAGTYRHAMRLLTVPQPMAAVLAAPGLHGRPVVDRRFTADYRGRIVLVAGDLDRSVMGDPLVRSTLADSGLDVDTLPRRGTAVALATLIDCHQAAGACCAPWGTTYAAFFHLVLDDIRPLTRSLQLPARPGLTPLDGKEHAAVVTAL